MFKITERILLIAAAFFVVIGLVYPFVNLGRLPQAYVGPEHISSLFSLAGVFLFVAALIYQMREYRLQVDELKKTAQAQEDTSRALNEQKEILIEQTSNTFVFNVVEAFVRYKNQPEVQSAILKCYENYITTFRIFHQQQLERVGISKAEATKEFANYIHKTFHSTIKDRDEFYTIKNFVQHAYNVLYLIDKKRGSGMQDWFTPYFHNQLLKRERLVLYLTTIGYLDMPLVKNLYWNYHVAKEFIGAVQHANNEAHYDAELLSSTLNEHVMKIATG